MRRALVAGNWKMHGSQNMVSGLMKELVHALGEGVNGVDVVVCPPAPYLSMVGELMFGSEIVLGAQNVCAEAEGAFTGEVSAAMLADFRVRYVIVGHSERRALFGEDDRLVARKFAAVRSQSLTPVLCVGETLEHREAGRAQEVVAAQLEAVLADNGVASFEKAVVAYEPVWAIGTGKTASPGQAQEMHQFIRELIAGRDQEVAGKLQILYGGSVNADNAAELFAQPDIDGGLVGGASLQAEAFIKICNSVS